MGKSSWPMDMGWPIKGQMTNETLFEIASMSEAFGATPLVKQIGKNRK